MRLNIEINEKLQKDIKNYINKNNLTIKDFVTTTIENEIKNKNTKKVKDFTVAIICGGPSAERGISLNSARSTADHLEDKNIKIVVFYVDKKLNYYKISREQLYSNTPSDFDFKLKTEGQFLTQTDLINELRNITIVFPIIHGDYGEDGRIQEFLEKNNIPFVGTGSISCKNSFNKITCSKILNEYGFFNFPSISFFEDKRENEILIKRFFDLNKLKKAVVKPANGGSSIGVHCVYTYQEAIDKVKLLFSENMSPIVIEPFCTGREFTIVLIKNIKTGEPVALLPSEIEMKYENYQIFDYRRKYLPTAQTRYYTPARFNEEDIDKIRKYSQEIFKIMEFNDFVRIDGWLLNDGRIWFSDINIASGMEQNSFVFQQSSRIGFTHKDFVRYVLKSACLRYGIEMPEEEKIDNKNKKKVNVLFGGINAEREVSLMSGTNIWLKLLKSDRYLPTPYLLDRNNDVWYLPYCYNLNHTVEEIYENCVNANSNIEISQKLITKICKELDIEEYKLELPIKYSFQEFIELCKKENAFVFLGLHGGKGEDGTIQKELTKNGLLYNGSYEKGSRLGMDKYETGKLIENLKDNVLITAPKVKFKIGDFEDYNNEKDFWDNVVNKLSSNSFIIKPATDGSSAGAVRIYDLKDFKTYIDILKDKAPYIPANTFKNQSTIIEMPSNNEQDFLLEAFIETDDIIIENNKINYKQNTGWLELTVGVIEENGKYHSLNPSITIAENKILTIEEKFQGGTGVNITPPPESIINKDLLKLIKENIEKSAKVMGLKNYARLDIFVNNKTNKIILIEANTLPALTPSTVIFHQALCEGLNPRMFLEKIIEMKK